MDFRSLRVNALGLTGGSLDLQLAVFNPNSFDLEATRFTPSGEGWMQFRNQRCRAVRLRITDRDAYQPVLTALVFLSEIQKMHPRNLGMGPMLQMLGSRWAPEAVRRGDDPRDIFRRWEAENAAWKERVEKYRLYPAE